MKNNAYSIVEVVVVMLILAIITIIMLGTLNSDEVNNKALEQAAKAMYLQVEKATRSVVLNNTNNYTLERMKDSSGEFSIASSSSLNRMVELYKENMILARNATQDSNYLSGELTDNTTTWSGISPSYFTGFTLRNESYIGFKLNNNCTTTISYIYDPLMPDKRSVANTCGIIFYDTNGDKKPNILGVDQFILAIGKLGLK